MIEKEKSKEEIVASSTLNINAPEILKEEIIKKSIQLEKLKSENSAEFKFPKYDASENAQRIQERAKDNWFVFIMKKIVRT